MSNFIATLIFSVVLPIIAYGVVKVFNRSVSQESKRYKGTFLNFFAYGFIITFAGLNVGDYFGDIPFAIYCFVVAVSFMAIQTMSKLKE